MFPLQLTATFPDQGKWLCFNRQNSATMTRGLKRTRTIVTHWGSSFGCVNYLSNRIQQDIEQELVADRLAV
jgi:hypothetical protein